MTYELVNFGEFTEIVNCEHEFTDNICIINDIEPTFEFYDDSDESHNIEITNSLGTRVCRVSLTSWAIYAQRKEIYPMLSGSDCWQ